MAHIPEFQTRNEIGSMKFFETFIEAYAESMRDPTVWKISFYDTAGQRHRWVRTIRTQLSETLNTFSKLARCSDIVWYDQPLISDGIPLAERARDDFEYPIKEVLAPADLFARYA